MSELATVTNGEYKGEIVAPYCKLRFGWLCDLGSTHNDAIAYIDHEHLRFWVDIKSIRFENGQPVIEYK